MNDYNILITGTMRSGTSLCTRILNSRGITMGDLEKLPFSEYNKEEHNEDGYYQVHSVTKFESEFLENSGLGWYTSSKIPTIKDIGKDQLSYIMKIKNTINSMREPTWCIKSPSFMKTVHLWRYIMKKMVVIYCFRDPESVYRSIIKKHRDNGNVNLISDKFWKNNNLSFLKSLNDIPIILVHYDDWFNQPEKMYDHIQRKLKLYDIQINSYNNIDFINKDKRHFMRKSKIKSFSLKETWDFLMMWYQKQLKEDTIDVLNVRCMDISKIDSFIISDLPKYQQMNSKCKCGSGLKHKRCCM
jgi:hypothetical protein